MAYRDKQWFSNALEAARARVALLQARINAHIQSDEFDSAKMLLTDFADALTDANYVANQFADKFSGEVGYGTIMGEVIQPPNRNVQHASSEQLKREWDLWSEHDGDDDALDGVEFHFEEIHAELNRRGEGRYCAV